MQWLEQVVDALPERGVSSAVLRVMNRFESEMTSQGMTKTELSKRSGLNRVHLSRILSEPSNVTMGTLVSIANALDMSLEIRALPRQQQTWKTETEKVEAAARKPLTELLEGYCEGEPLSLPAAA